MGQEVIVRVTTYLSSETAQLPLPHYQQAGWFVRDHTVQGKNRRRVLGHTDSRILVGFPFVFHTPNYAS